MWDEVRQGLGEVFSLVTAILAVDGPTAVVRAAVRYGEPVRQEYGDLWIMQTRDDGRCSYWPGATLLRPRRALVSGGRDVLLICRRSRDGRSVTSEWPEQGIGAALSVRRVPRD
jgi:hypothetical protein